MLILVGVVFFSLVRCKGYVRVNYVYMVLSLNQQQPQKNAKQMRNLLLPLVSWLPRIFRVIGFDKTKRSGDAGDGGFKQRWRQNNNGYIHNMVV